LGLSQGPPQFLNKMIPAQSDLTPCPLLDDVVISAFTPCHHLARLVLTDLTPAVLPTFHDWFLNPPCHGIHLGTHLGTFRL